MHNISESDQALKALLKTVTARKGSADFFIIDNSNSTDAALIQQISDRLERAPIRHASIDLSEVPTASDLLDSIRYYKQQGYDFLHVTGGDAWFLERQPFNDGTTYRLDVLNILREEIFKEKMKLAFYLSEAGIRTFVDHAFDLFSWRSGIYKLSATSNPQISETPSFENL